MRRCAAAAAGAGWVDIGGGAVLPGRADRVARPRRSTGSCRWSRRSWPTSDVVVSVDTDPVRRSPGRAGRGRGGDQRHQRSARSGARPRSVADSAATLVITHSLRRPGQQHLRRPRVRRRGRPRSGRSCVARVELAMSCGVAGGADRRSTPVTTSTRTPCTHWSSPGGSTRSPPSGCRVLAAVSNKDFVGEATGLAKADRRRGLASPPRPSAPCTALGSCACTTCGRGPRGHHGRGRPGSARAGLSAAQLLRLSRLGSRMRRVLTRELASRQVANSGDRCRGGAAVPCGVVKSTSVPADEGAADHAGRRPCRGRA